MQDRLLKVRQAAEVLSCHPDTVRKMIRRGELPGRHAADGLRVTESAVERLIAGAELPVDVESVALKAHMAGLVREVTDLGQRLEQMRQEVRELHLVVHPGGAA